MDKEIRNAKLINDLRTFTTDELVTFGYLCRASIDYLEEGKFEEAREYLTTVCQICGDIITAREEAEMQG